MDFVAVEAAGHVVQGVVVALGLIVPVAVQNEVCLHFFVLVVPVFGVVPVKTAVARAIRAMVGYDC